MIFPFIFSLEPWLFCSKWNTSSWQQPFYVLKVDIKIISVAVNHFFKSFYRKVKLQLNLIIGKKNNFFNFAGYFGCEARSIYDSTCNWVHDTFATWSAKRGLSHIAGCFRYEAMSNYTEKGWFHIYFPEVVASPSPRRRGRREAKLITSMHIFFKTKQSFILHLTLTLQDCVYILDWRSTLLKDFWINKLKK